MALRIAVIITPLVATFAWSSSSSSKKGFYYRSDHFNFAKVGIPSLDTDDGLDYVRKPPGFGQLKKDEFAANDYHSPTDEVKPGWDL
jgi:Zn-dependent M28 family amino/carboxypeptidase